MDLEKKAIERIQFANKLSLYYYEQPIICTYSGGKDSDVLLELFKKSGVQFTIQHNHTTADAPETVYHIRNKFKELENEGYRCGINYPVYERNRITMWSLIPRMGIPPTRFARYCCRVLKEQNGRNSFIATGVRKAESTKRQARTEIETITSNVKKSTKTTISEVMSGDNIESRRLIEHCKLRGKMTINPIIDWSDREVWNYIKSENIKVNPLYSCGNTRVGCIGCPLSGRKNMLKSFSRYPTYKEAYIRSFDKMLEVNQSKTYTWKTGQDVFDWWVQEPSIPGQISLFDLNR